MIQRLIDFYQRTTVADIHPIWDLIINQQQPRLLKALQEGNPEALTAALDSLAPNGETIGMELSRSIGIDDPLYQSLLLRLACRIGALPLNNPEQPSPTENWKSFDWESLRKKVESELGFPLHAPKCFGFNESTEIPHRFFYYASAAFTAERFMGKKPVDILEIGAGLGNLGLIGKHWGSKTYTVIDLPSCAVIAAYFVAQCCGEDKVWLAGEKWRSDAYAYFYPSTNYDEVREFAFDLIFNSDSFPEIVPAIQDAYIKLISECLTHEGIFLSINHESDKAQQSSVHDAVKRNGGLKMAYRAPFMMRDGYVEEIYRLA